VAFKNPLRLALFGARGIGKTHARIFHELGAEITAVLGSTETSARAAAGELKESFGVCADSFSDYGRLLDAVRPDAVSICTPPELHYEEIMAAFDRNIPVFCEKPLFWQKEIDACDIDEKLEALQNHPRRRIFVNTSNAYFAELIADNTGIPSELRSFSFLFHTQGRGMEREIAFDLLPHGFALLIRIAGERAITDLAQEVSPHSFLCSFSYGACRVKFDFREYSEGAKALSFSFNGREFVRVQEGFGPTYRVFLEDSLTGERIEAEDPFRVYIRRFLKFCGTGSAAADDGFNEAAANMRLMKEVCLSAGDR